MEGLSSPSPEKSVSTAERIRDARSQAIEEVYERTKVRLKNTFEALGSPEDLLVQEALQLQEVAKKLLEEAVLEGDYRKEQATAKFEAFVGAYAELVKRFAELKSLHPDSNLLNEIAPALSGLEKRGQTLKTLH